MPLPFSRSSALFTFLVWIWVPLSGSRALGQDTKPAELDRQDDLVKNLLGKQSDNYLTRGFGKFNFGISREEVGKIQEIIGKSNDSDAFLLKDGSRVWFDDNGELVGVMVDYSRNDNKRSVERLRDLFGPAGQIDELSFAENFTPSRESTVRATYHFPETIACVRVTERIAVLKFNGQSVRTEWVAVAAFDRKWATKELSRELHRRRQMIEWLGKVAKATRPRGFDKSSLPDYPQASKEEKALASEEGVYWIPVPSKKSDEAIGGGAFLNPNWFAAIGVVTNASPQRAPAAGGLVEGLAALGALGVVTNVSPQLPKDTVFCSLRIRKMPGSPAGPIMRSALYYLVEKGTCDLLQEQFPPRGEKITIVRNPTGAKTYEWLTQTLSEVQLQPDETIRIFVRPD